MKKYIKLFLILFLKVGFSQIGINTTNPSSNTVLHIDASGNNKNLQPTSETVKDDVVFTKDGQIGVGTINPRVKLDVRSGDNSRNNTIGIGGTNQSASEAGEGAIRYLPINGGVMQYSDGIKWIQIKTPDIEKTSVVARIFTEPNQPQHQFGSQFKSVTDFNILFDNRNAFDAYTGIFTAPNKGNFLISFTYDFDYSWIKKNGITEVQFIKDDGTNQYIVRKCMRSFASYGTEGVPNAIITEAGGLCIGVASLNSKDKLLIQLRQTISNDFSNLRVVKNPNDTSEGFNNLTISEQ